MLVLISLDLHLAAKFKEQYLLGIKVSYYYLQTSC